MTEEEIRGQRSEVRNLRSAFFQGDGMKAEVLERWTCDNAADLYGIRNWGSGYFDIAASGDIVVQPFGPASKTSISIMDLIAGLKARGLNMPILLRFADILSSRIKQMYENFNTAIRDYGYQGVYRGVYPIKVNQQKQVVAEIMEFGRPYHHGLEAGSKAELMAAIAYTEDPEALIVCNGVVPQVLWSKRVRHSIPALFAVAMVVNVGMWLERFIIVVTSLHRDFLPSSWDMYHPTFWDWSTFVGTLGLFVMLMFLFIRVMPMISIFEMRTLLPEARAKAK